MNSLSPAVILLCLAVAAAGDGSLDGAAADDPAEGDQPAGRRILAAVRRNLPREPLLIEGSLLVRKRRGFVLSEIPFQMRLEWGAAPPRAVYTVGDAFGGEQERLTVLRDAGKGARFTYMRGDPPAPAPLPDLEAPIRDTALSWVDLTLSFLWWTDAQRVGTEDVRGRPCHVLDVQPAGAGPDDGAYARVRLWIDRKLLMLLQAEAFDEAGRAIKRLWIDSFKKVDDRWMIKDMDVQGPSDVRRTRLTVYDVSAASTP